MEAELAPGEFQFCHENELALITTTLTRIVAVYQLQTSNAVTLVKAAHYNPALPNSWHSYSVGEQMVDKIDAQTAFANLQCRSETTNSNDFGRGTYNNNIDSFFTPLIAQPEGMCSNLDIWL